MSSEFKAKSSKKLIILCFSILILLSMTSCQSELSEKRNKDEEYMGYITDINTKALSLDDFEFITPKNEKRVKELGLTQNNMPDGYYIHNYSEDILSLKINSKTEFTFYDRDNLFMEKDGDSKYTTRNLDDFKDFLYYDSVSPRKFLFKVKVKRGKVVSVVEQTIN